VFVRTIGRIMVVGFAIYIKIVLDPAATFFGKERSLVLQSDSV